MKRSLRLTLTVCALLFALALTLSACNGGSDTQTPTDAPDVTDAPANNDATDDEPGDEPTEPHVHEFGEWAVVTEATCTAAGLEERACTCGEKESRDIAALGHTEVIDAAVAPTCTETGLTEGKHCSVCNEILVAQEEVAALGHTEEIIPAVAPNCIETGLTEGKHCSVCDTVLVAQEVVAATGHTAGEAVEENRVDPSCTDEGSYDVVVYCSVCDAEVSRDIKMVDANGHTEAVTPAVAPTCTETGLTEGKHCSICDTVLVAQVEVPMIPHTYDDKYDESCNKCGFIRDAECAHKNTEIIPEITATCTKAGLTAGEKCLKCGEILVKQEIVPATGHSHTSVVTAPTCTEQGYTTHTCHCGDSYVDSYVDALGHSFGEWVETKAPTCTEKGSERRDCERCDHFETREVAATGHSHTSVVTAPTCTEQGYTTHTCHCGDSYVDTYVDALGHSFSEWTVTQEATCTEKGSERRDCANCDHFETRDVAATGHNYKSVVTAPICTEKGYTTHTCHCGDSYVDTYVDVLGHSFGEWVETKAPTCTEKGSERRDCERCDNFETRDVAATGHDHTSVVTAPTCTEQGYTTHTCHCGDNYVDTYVDALGHSFGDWVETKAPTCTEKGSERRDCERCDNFETREVAALGHTEEIMPAVAPTCTATGLTEGKKCSVCGDILKAQEIVEKLGHTEVIDAAVAPTCTKTGLTEGKHCSVCNEVIVSQEEVAVLGHTEVIDAAVEPTCTKAGLTEGKHCSVCNEVIVSQEEVAVLGHTEVIDAAVAPTCTKTGLTEGKRCSICKTITVQQTIIDSLGHKYDNELDAICNTCNEKREVDEILLSISTNDVFGYVKGLESIRRSIPRNNACVILYNATNSYTTQLGSNNEYFFQQVPAGKYYLKIEIAGYQVPEPIEIQVDQNGNILQHIEISQMIGSDFYYHWRADKTYFGYEESATVPSEKTFTFLDEVVTVNDSNATAKLQRHYKIILSNEELNWSSDYASRILDLVEGIYEFPRDIPSKWVLTYDEIDDDIEITYETESSVIRISKAAFENATPRKAEYNGLKGTYFSNRLYHALIRYATKEGTDINYIDRILQHDYGCSIIIEDYAALTAGITNETNAAFEMFKPEELLAILEMFAEMPQGFHRIENLEYLVRRIDGVPNPIYPDAAAVSWIYADHGYIEFMDVAFLGSEVEDTFRLVLHEKAHFLWAHVFSDELKAKWIEIGGWYKTSNDSDEWSTTKETEFVTAYAHGINPDEDMAESIAYYILMPDRLESRSPAKYAFIRDYIMNGEIYISQIREDLTFEVYNLYPDYNYPGKIVGIDIQATGAPEEDKQVTVTVTLDTNGDPSFGATSGFMRIFSDADTFYDLYVTAVDESNAVLKGTFTVSKYACSGYWHNEQITLSDIVGNQRFVGVDNFGWKLYINNPLADMEKPQYEKDSIHVEMEKGEIEGRPVTYVHVKFKAADNIGIKNVYCAMANNTTDGYRIEGYGTFDNETGEGIITFVFTEYMQSGEYSINQLDLIDYAENRNGYSFYADGTGSGGYPATFTFYSENSDYEAPTVDVNRITVTATPTHPENPNGETVVHIEFYAKDNASGLGLVSYKLLDPLGNTHGEYHYHENFYTTYFEGDPAVWTKYEIDVILPEGSAPGKWGLLEIYVADKAGNFTTYNFLEILHFQVASD